METEYERIERAIRYLESHASEQPGLDEVAAAAGLSPFHFQRLFRRWAGVSPKRFLQLLTVEHAKHLLAGSASVLDAAFEAGLSGPGRLHDHFVTLEAVSPGEYKHGGAGLEIRHGVHPSPFGLALVGETDRGVCALAFVDRGGEPAALDWLRSSWPEARLAADPAATRATVRRIFERRGPTPLLVSGTNFQVQVWRALLAIPPGRVCSYGRLARAVGRPGAARAVGAAVGANRISYLIPCHRVIRAVGALGGYRWGTRRKRAMLAWESARRAPDAGRATAEAAVV